MKKIFILLLLITYYLLLKNPVMALEPTYSHTIFTNIVPGKTTEGEVLSLLGKPTKDFYSQQKDIFWYQAQDGIRFQTVIFEKKIVSLVTLHIPENQAENLKNYGPADQETYNYYRYDTRTYIYGKLGLALTADMNGKILVKQKFVPGTYVDFLNKWGKEFPQENPYTEGYKSSPTPIPSQSLSEQFSIKNIFSSFVQIIKDFINQILIFMVPSKI